MSCSQPMYVLFPAPIRSASAACDSSLHPGTLQVLADGHGFFSSVGILHLILGPVFLYSFEIPTI